jgi:DNA-binding CsgD family transcriptional regulator
MTENENPWLQDNLTPKQKEYVADLASGKDTLQISEEKYVSHHTVRNTLSAAKERVGASSTTNLIAMAIVKGWILISNDAPPYAFEPANG